MTPPFVTRAIARLANLVVEINALPTYEFEDDEFIGNVTSALGERVPRYAPRSFTRITPSAGLIVRIRQAVRDIAPDTLYFKAVENEGSMESLRDHVDALITELKVGNLNHLHDLAHAEVFSDILDSSEYLLENGHKDPAAVLAGGVAESHLRQLALKNGIATTNAQAKPLMGNALNVELAKANVYDVNTSKLMTAYQGIRNDAAHGDYGKYDAGQVGAMILGIRTFMMSHPA